MRAYIMKYSLTALGVIAISISILSTSWAGELKGSGRTPNNTMLVKIDPGGIGTMTENLVLPLNKAAIVELPANARDVIVPSSGIADVVMRTPRRAFIMGRAVGQTNAFFLDASGKQILNLEIRVERDMDSLNEMLKTYLPASRIEAKAINDNVVLSGFVASAAESDQARAVTAKFIGEEAGTDRVVNMLAIEGNEQVLLRVRVVEMQRTVLKQFGVDANALFAAGSQTSLGLLTQNPFSSFGRSLSDTAFSSSYSNPGNTTGLQSVTGILRLMERVGMVRTLAEPNLTAISGESANFLAGGEFPVPTGRDREGNVLIEFKPFGVGLGFSPIVMSEGRISLRISTEVSELSNEGAIVLSQSTFTDADGNVTTIAGTTIPALRVRRAETTVEMPSGGSLVMAGLIQESTKQSLDGVPGMKDIPVLGTLFRSRDFRKSETELVVIVTPYLVNAVNEKQLKTPIDHSAAASDIDTILMGRLSAVYGINRGAAAQGNWDGPMGHIVE